MGAVAKVGRVDPTSSNSEWRKTGQDGSHTGVRGAWRGWAADEVAHRRPWASDLCLLNSYISFLGEGRNL
ncbi:unnamed protein product [Urochloa humidicola]